MPFRRARPAERTGWPEGDAPPDFVAELSQEREAIHGPQPDELVVQPVQHAGRRTLVLRGALSLDSVETLESALREIRPETTRAITLDLSELAFIDSSGLWAVTSTRKWCRQRMIRFSIVPGPEPVQRVFELTGLSDLLPFEADRGDRRPSPPR